MQQRHVHIWLAMGTLALAMCAAAECARASVTFRRPLNLNEQIARADYAAHVVILGIESLQHVDNGPFQACGTRYRVQVIEQFKGKLDSKVTAFATLRFLLPAKKLQAGDQALVLLRRATGIATAADLEGSPSAEELDALSAKPGTLVCQRARGNLYLTDSAENIFLIDSTSGSTAWLQFEAGGTVISPDIGTPKLARCEPLPGGGCIKKEPDRIEWERVRDALRSGPKLGK